VCESELFERPALSREGRLELVELELAGTIKCSQTSAHSRSGPYRANLFGCGGWANSYPIKRWKTWGLMFLKQAQPEIDQIDATVQEVWKWSRSDGLLARSQTDPCVEFVVTMAGWTVVAPASPRAM
jgi:hypothetical protein